MKMYIASDHAGFDRKEMLKPFIEGLGYEVIDLGPDTLDPNDDYPNYALPLAQAVAKDRLPGILLCGNAEGVCIVANKVKGVRAAVGYSEYAAESSRNDDDTNVLCVPGRAMKDIEAKVMVKTWLKTPFSKAERHVRRLKKLEDIESDM
jgi:ribose 5-phosphate isomerase B